MKNILRADPAWTTSLLRVTIADCDCRVLMTKELVDNSVTQA